MTFLKKYGLSAVSLNLICSALAIEVFTLVYGFFHLHCEDLKVSKNPVVKFYCLFVLCKIQSVCHLTRPAEPTCKLYLYENISILDIQEFRHVLSTPQVDKDGIPHTQKFTSPDCNSSWPYIDVDVGTLISADFATAAVLISFGVVLGITSPLQLVVMTILEVVIFVVNEILGRDYIGAIDAGDTIFVHVFGAYFGLTVARVLYNADHDLSSKQGASYTSDMFSMVGTVFLWMFWPSFNGGAAASVDAQQRAIINTCSPLRIGSRSILRPQK